MDVAIQHLMSHHRIVEDASSVSLQNTGAQGFGAEEQFSATSTIKSDPRDRSQS